jgi:isoleucyl-tRNA synthetase
VREIRRVVTGALELARADKKIGASLQARPVVHLTGERRAMLDGVDLGEISITSGITISDVPAADGAFTLAEVPGVAVRVDPAEGGKCERCWQVLPEVGSHAHHPTLCNRCTDVVEAA